MENDPHQNSLFTHTCEVCGDEYLCPCSCCSVCSKLCFNIREQCE